jgi:hypothetical protein
VRTTPPDPIKIEASYGAELVAQVPTFQTVEAMGVVYGVKNAKLTLSRLRFGELGDEFDTVTVRVCTACDEITTATSSLLSL